MDHEIKEDVAANGEETHPIEKNAAKKKNTLFSKKIISGLVFAIVLILVIVLVISLSRNKDEANNLRKTGTLSYYAGDTKSAKIQLEESLKLDPSDPKTFALLIKAIANEGSHNGTEGQSFNEGKKFADEALRQFPNNSEVLTAVGYLYEIGGKYNEALNYYNKAIQSDDKNADAYFHKGHVSEFLSLTSQASQNYQKAYSLNSNDAYIEMAEARTLLQMGKTDDAIKMFKNASNAQYNTPSIKSEALTNAAIIQRSQILKLTNSLSLAKEAVKADPTYSPALAEYSLNLFMTGDMNGAIDNMNAAIKANPRISQNYWRLGAFYKVGKNYQKAIELQEEALLKIEDDNTILGAGSKELIKSMMAYDLASTYSKAGNNDKALQNLNLAIGLNSILKKRLKDDFTNFGDFKGLANNADFKALIQ